MRKVKEARKGDTWFDLYLPEDAPEFDVENFNIDLMSGNNVRINFAKTVDVYDEEGQQIEERVIKVSLNIPTTMLAEFCEKMRENFVNYENMLLDLKSKDSKKLETIITNLKSGQTDQEN